MQRRRGMLFRVDVYAPLFWPMESERDGFTGLYFSISGAHTLYKTVGRTSPRMGEGRATQEQLPKLSSTGLTSERSPSAVPSEP